MKTIREKKLKKYTLILAYIIMLGICVWLNHDIRKIDSIIINGVMFIIVGVIFGGAIWGCFKKVDNIQNELVRTIARIELDFEHKNEFLWDSYKQNENFSFEQKDLKNAYESYKDEMCYLELQDSDGSKCDIEDYINRELIDNVAKKNLLNLVPGAMTGMGILGTFIGLSLGLQNFNTGTSEEIAESISPLMDGIKVAFHTSIFGMVFSLYFNYIYKKIFEEAYQTVDEFVDVYHKMVFPDTDSDNISKIIAGQQKQSKTIVDPIVLGFKTLNDNILEMCSVQQQQLQQLQQMPQVVEESIGRKLSEQIIPQFTIMNNNFEVFAKMVGDMQLKGMEDLVDKFTTQTNAVMVDGYQNLKDTISQTCDLQEENGQRMVDILNKVQSMTMNIQQINNLSQKTVADMSGYVEKVENLQEIITENCKSFGRQLEKNAEFESRVKDYIVTLDEYQKQCGETVVQSISELKRQSSIFEGIEKQVTEDARKEMEALINSTNECNKRVSEVAMRQIDSIGAYSDLKTEDMLNAVQKLEEVTNEFNTQLKKNLDNSNIVMKGNLEEMNNQLKDNLEISNNDMEKKLTDANIELQKNLENSNLTLKELKNQLQNDLNSLNNQLKNNLIESANTLNNNIGSVDQRWTEQTNVVLEEFNNISQELNKQLRKELKVTLDEFGNGLSENMVSAIGKFGDTTKQIENSAVGLSKISEKVHEQMSVEIEKILQKFTEEFAKNLSDIREKVTGTAEKLGNSADELGNISEKFHTKMSEDLENVFGKFTNMLEQTFSNMANEVEGTTTQLSNSTTKLGEATKELNKNMEKRLTGTFALFDRELSDICNHLSATILDVESTTGRVPNVVSAAYEGMEKTMEEIATQMVELIKQIEIMEAQIQRMKNI